MNLELIHDIFKEQPLTTQLGITWIDLYPENYVIKNNDGFDRKYRWTIYIREDAIIIFSYNITENYRSYLLSDPNIFEKVTKLINTTNYPI